MTLVVGVDVEAWLVPWLRQELAARGWFVEVARSEPAVGEFPDFLVVVTVVAGEDLSEVSSVADVNVSVLGGTLEKHELVGELARVVHALMRGCAGLQEGNPVAAVNESRGPFLVREVQPVARFLSTFSLTVVGEVLPG